ncbi:MAG: four helix bundle protein [Flavobacteriales bacterium]|jgi:four helix bundle protein|nr:four helix bundle protein [Flavobacteriales bacterium]MBK7941919.1 four helix bundle protein [Flavobacteriales bacterium]MBK8947722.1 four helix bundle protein [Flavobacteriales bacterium]MBK9700462.1 four helix bundle protein [Flavobacteriales bacterium]
MAGLKDLIVYKKSFELSMMIFELTKKFPVEERYSLTTQIRNSSRSVPANLAEAYRKRRYLAAFIAKLTDCDGENAETSVHLDTALACNYITSEEHAPAVALNAEVGRLLCDMLNSPGKYGVKAR